MVTVSMGLHVIAFAVVSVLSLVSCSYDDGPVFPVLSLRPPLHRQRHMTRGHPILPVPMAAGIHGRPMPPRLPLSLPVRPRMFPVMPRPGPWLLPHPRHYGPKHPAFPPKMIRITSKLPVSGGAMGLPLKRHPLFGKGKLGMGVAPIHNWGQRNFMQRFPPLRPMSFRREMGDDNFFGRAFDNERAREHFKDSFEERFENRFDDKENNMFANRRPIHLRQGPVGRGIAATQAPTGRILPAFQLPKRDGRDEFPSFNNMFSNPNVRSLGSGSGGFGTAGLTGWPQDDRHSQNFRPLIDDRSDLPDGRFAGSPGVAGFGLSGNQQPASTLPFIGSHFGMDDRDDFSSNRDDGKGILNTPSHRGGIAANLAGGEIDDSFMKRDDKERDLDLLNTDIRSIDDLIAHAGPVFGSDGFENIPRSEGRSLTDDHPLDGKDMRDSHEDRAGHNPGPIAGMELLGRSQWDDIINELATVGSQQQGISSDEHLAVFPVNPHSNNRVHHRTPTFDVLSPMGQISEDDRFSGLGSDAFSVLGIDPNSVTMLSETGNHRALEVVDAAPSTSALTPDVPPPIPLPDGTISVVGTPSKTIPSSPTGVADVGTKTLSATGSGFVDDSMAALGTFIAAKAVLDEVGN